MQGWFYGCSSLVSLDLADIDREQVVEQFAEDFLIGKDVLESPVDGGVHERRERIVVPAVVR